MNRQEFLRNLSFGASSLPNVKVLTTQWVPEHKTMTEQNESFSEVIIIGGSYAGLAAAMALGRSLRKVLILDAGEPCNRQTPHSHNFLTDSLKDDPERFISTRNTLSEWGVPRFFFAGFNNDKIVANKTI